MDTYIVMEWLDGESLEGHLIRRKNAGVYTCPLTEAVAMLSPAAEALSVAHDLSIAHRDIKPANLFLTQLGKKATLKVVDFGIAKVLADNVISAEGMVSSGEDIFAFSPQYAAPEQFDPKIGPTGPWTDVFAFSLVLIELASGKPALRGNGYFQHMMSALDPEQHPTFRGWGIQASATAEAVLAKALAREPSQRFQSVTELWEALRYATRTSVTMMPAQVPDSSAAPWSKSAPSGVDNVSTTRPPVSPIGVVGENRLCTILAVDFSELSALADELDPAELSELTAWCAEQLALCTEELGGSVDRMATDSLVAVFGAPRSHENDAERATLAALRMRDVMQSIVDGDLRLAERGVTARMGLHTGNVFVTPPRRGHTHAEPSVVGETVNIASLIVQHAASGEIVISRDTLRHVEGCFNVEPLPTIDGRGKHKSLQTFRVEGPTSLRVPILRSDFYGLPTKLVGRDDEMALLDDKVERLVARRGAELVTILGVSGVGRTRVLGELFLRLSQNRETFFVLAGRASLLADQSPYSFIVSILRARFSIVENDTIDSTSEKILAVARGWVTQPASASGSVLPAPPSRARGAAEASADTSHLASDVLVLATMLVSRGLRAEQQPLANDEQPSISKHRVGAALARLLGYVMSRSPVVLLCDDIHWADEASLDLLEDLVLRTQDHPVLLVTTARSELLEHRPQWGESLSQHTRIELKKLSSQAVAEMVDDRLQLAVEAPSRDFVELLVQRAAGIALVLTETLQLFVDAGVIERRHDQPWLIHEERARAMSIPDSVRGLIQSRMDQLDDDERSLIVLASVVGDTFWEGSLSTLASSAQLRSMTRVADPALTAALLARLRDRRLIRAREPSTIPGDREFSFVEPSLREVAYETLSAKVRRLHHRIVADWLSPRLRGDAHASLLARHHDRAGRLEAAVNDYARAAAHAATFGRNLEALRLYERAREILVDSQNNDDRKPSSSQTSMTSDVPSRRVAPWSLRARVYLEVGDVLLRLGRLDDAEQAMTDARAMIPPQERRAGQTLDPRETALWHARALMRLAQVSRVRGDLVRARSRAEEALSVATRAQALAERTAILTALAGIHRREGNLEACREAALRGLRLCRAVLVRDHNWRDAVANLLIALGAVFYSTKQLVRAERCYRQAARLAAESTNPRTASFALNDIAVIRYVSGDYANALAMFLRSLALKEREGDLYQVAIAHNNVAEVNLHLGNGADALDHARRAVNLGERVGAASDLCDMLRNYAEALMATGALENAFEQAIRAFEEAAKASSVYQIDVAVTLANVAAAVAKSRPRNPSLLQATGLLEGLLISKTNTTDRRYEQIRSALESAKNTSNSIS
ncbi:MAG: AAA family ATPase [Polyangiaceae bacterium]